MDDRRGVTGGGRQARVQARGVAGNNKWRICHSQKEGERESNKSPACSHLWPCTVEQHDRLLERQGVPDLHLAVRTLQHIKGEKEQEGCRPLDALQHALLGEVAGPIVVPHLRRTSKQASGEKLASQSGGGRWLAHFEPHSFELEVDG